jgi:hypothetical protein
MRFLFTAIFLLIGTAVQAQTITVAWDAPTDNLWTVPEFRLYKNQTGEVWATSALMLAIPVSAGESGSVSVSSYGWRLDANLNTVWAEGAKSPAVAYAVPLPPPPPPPPAPPSDTLAPLVSLAASRNGKSANYTLTAFAADDVGVVRLRLFIDGSPFYTCSGSPCAATVKLRSAVTFSAEATDAAGNVGSASRVVP